MKAEILLVDFANSLQRFGGAHVYSAEEALKVYERLQEIQATVSGLTSSP